MSTSIAWLTDIHLNHLPGPDACHAFGASVRAQLGTSDGAIVISGDIAECKSLETLFSAFVAGVGTETPIYFVLGNHDLYGGSQDKARTAARNMNAIYLTEKGVVELSANVALVGHDGWYDARNGNPHIARMNDFSVIQDLLDADGMKLPREKLIVKLQELADRAVHEAEKLVRAAASKYSTVYFVTHVPPFERAAWYRPGVISSNGYLPFMSCRAMGDMLVDVAHSFQDVNFTVLCGHTHGEGEYNPMSNLTVLTGAATYGTPETSRFFTV